VVVIGRAENDGDDDTRDSAAQQHVVVDGKTSRRRRNDTTNTKLVLVVERETAVDFVIVSFRIFAQSHVLRKYEIYLSVRRR
jgi:hypothetical protein